LIERRRERARALALLFDRESDAEERRDGALAVEARKRIGAGRDERSGLGLVAAG